MCRDFLRISRLAIFQRRRCLHPFQYGADLRIVVAARQPYYAKLPAAQLYDIADGEAGLLDGFSAIGEGDGIFEKVYSIVLFRIFPLSFSELFRLLFEFR